MNHKINILTLNKLKYHTTLRNEFIIMSTSDFTEKLNSDSHFKNKFYSFLLFKKAGGSIVIDNQTFDLQPERFFFINYNQVYNFENSQQCTGEVILFTKSFYNYVYTGNKAIKSDTALNNVSPFIVLNPENKEDVWQTFDELNNEYQTNKSLRKEIICLLLKVFALKYIRNSNRKNRVNQSLDHKKEMADKFNDLVNQHYKEFKTTSKYAEKLNLTPNYLNVIVKETLDINAGQVIRNRIILEAERLLNHTTLSITEISYELGFTDNSHFGKYFKSATKVSPNQYRLLGNLQ